MVFMGHQKFIHRDGLLYNLKILFYSFMEYSGIRFVIHNLIHWKCVTWYIVNYKTSFILRKSFRASPNGGWGILHCLNSLYSSMSFDLLRFTPSRYTSSCNSLISLTKFFIKSNYMLNIGLTISRNDLHYPIKIFFVYTDNLSFTCQFKEKYWNIAIVYYVGHFLLGIFHILNSFYYLCRIVLCIILTLNQSWVGK